jgi:hypothetical protein
MIKLLVVRRTLAPKAKPSISMDIDRSLVILEIWKAVIHNYAVFHADK